MAAAPAPIRSLRSCAERARSSTCACAATTTTRRSSPRGRRALEPFLAAGDDVYAFFRHDADGRAAELAMDLRARVEA